MKSNKFLIELKDPYSKNITNFPKATVGASPSVALEPGDKPESDFDEEGKVKPPNNTDVVQAMDLDPTNVSCIQDLIDNWVHYAAFGALIATSAAPIIRPLLKIGGKTGTALWKSVTAPGQSIKNLSNSIQPIMKNFSVKSLPSKSFQAMGRIPKWFLAADQFSNARAKLMQGKGYGRIVGAGGSGVLGLLKIARNSATLALILVITYEGLGLKKFFNWGEDLPEDSIVMAFQVIDSLLQHIIYVDTGVLQIALYSNSNLERKCLMTNAIATAVLASYFIGPFGGHSKALYKYDDTKTLKNADDLRAFTISEKTKLVNKFTKEVDDAIRPVSANYNISDNLLNSYLNMLHKSDEKALKILQNNGVKNASDFHQKSVNLYNSKQLEMSQKLKDVIKDHNLIIQNANKSDEMVKARKIGSNFLERAKQTLNVLKRDPAMGSFQTGADDAASLGKINKMTDNFDNVNVLSKFDNIEDAARAVNKLEDGIVTGKISLRQGSAIYANSFKNNLSAVMDEVIEAMDLPKDVSKLSVSQKIEGITNSLADLSKNQSKLDEAIALMGPKGSSPTWFQKAFNTRNNKRIKDINKLESAQKAVKMAKDEILTVAPGIKMDDLAKVETQIQKAYKALEKAHGAGATTTIQDVGTLVRQISITAGLIALSGVIARTFFVDSTDDLQTWQQTDIARSLAWGGFFPAAALEVIYVVNKPAEWMGLVEKPESSEQAFQKALIKIVEEIIDPEDGTGNARILRGLYEGHIFDTKRGTNKNFIKNVAEMDTIDPIAIANNFRKSKNQYNKIIDTLIIKFGANLDGFGGLGLSPDDKSIAYRKLWYPPIISILIANSGLVDRLAALKEDQYYPQKSTEEKEKFLTRKIFKFINPNDVTEHLISWVEDFKKMVADKQQTRLEERVFMKDQKEKQSSLLKNLVSEVMSENYGKGYNSYPYHSHVGEEGEPAQDFIQDWKDFELALVRDESRNTAVKIAKILVKDLELFGDVLDLVGKNQSVATEILKNFKETS